MEEKWLVVSELYVINVMPSLHYFDNQMGWLLWTSKPLGRAGPATTSLQGKWELLLENVFQPFLASPRYIYDEAGAE